jgi:hypothetical protein
MRILMRWRGSGLIELGEKTEYPISNTEYPMSKWAVALIGVPYAGWDCSNIERRTRIKQWSEATSSLDHWEFRVGYWIFKKNDSERFKGNDMQPKRKERQNIHLNALVWASLGALILLAVPAARAQDSAIRYGRRVPSAVRLVNERGLAYLAATQQDSGAWPGTSNNGSAITGICVMAFMASGGDPDFGPHAENVRRALRRIILDQNAQTGHITGGGHGSMYHHGLAMLALSEAYGVVNERLLWQGHDVPEEERRTLGQALELAVRCALTAQKKNPFGAWRYSPESQDADTTVSGTVLMGLLGARNAGIEIPDEAVEKALSFFRLNTMRDGNVSYQPASSHGDGLCRASIATLVYAVAKRKDLPEYKAAAAFIRQRIDQDVTQHVFYTRYYLAQALFHSDIEAWKAWNQRMVEKLQTLQQADGSISSPYGPAYGTGMSLLALALNYRLLPVYER